MVRRHERVMSRYQRGNMAESLYKSLLLIFLVLFADFSDVQCTELTFELPDKVEQCFYEDIKKDTKCILDFQVGP